VAAQDDVVCTWEARKPDGVIAAGKAGVGDGDVMRGGIGDIADRFRRGAVVRRKNRRNGVEIDAGDLGDVAFVQTGRRASGDGQIARRKCCHRR